MSPEDAQLTIEKARGPVTQDDRLILYLEA